VRVVLLYNPIAGRGRGRAAAEALSRDLADAGHDVAVHPTRLEPAEDWLDSLLRGAGLLVVVGGDGAVRMAAPSAARLGTPLYQCPLGTENLFAREFGMDRTAARLLGAIDGGRTQRVDMASVDGRRFLLMVSAGFDAEVIHDLATRRTGRITHFSYVAPIVRRFARWSAPRLSVTVDGTSAVEGERGFVVVANCRQYARRLDPASRAVMTDGLLDAAFFPAATRREVLAWVIRCARRRQLRHPRLVYRTGREVTIVSDPPCRFQLDGDRPEPGEAPGDGRVKRLDVSIEPAALPVLLP